MSTREVEVVARAGSPERVTALLQVCDCGRSEFLVYLLPDPPALNQPRHETFHPHLQCASCGLTFCQATARGCRADGAG